MWPKVQAQLMRLAPGVTAKALAPATEAMGVAEMEAVGAAGAGGSWPTIGEKPGGAVAQSSSVSCGAACGEMVSGISQAALIEQAGAPTTPEALGAALSMKAGYVGPEAFKPLMSASNPWIAELRGVDSGRLSHFVVVDGFKAGHVMIRDPWAGGSTYRMTVGSFQEAWTGRAVFK
jgi:hypothetical protein